MNLEACARFLKAEAINNGYTMRDFRLMAESLAARYKLNSIDIMMKALKSNMLKECLKKASV